jgi:hypothetical protein
MLTVTPCHRLWNFDEVTANVTGFRLLSARCRGVTQTTVHVTGRYTQRFGCFLEPDQFRGFGLGTPMLNGEAAVSGIRLPGAHIDRTTAGHPGVRR